MQRLTTFLSSIGSCSPLSVLVVVFFFSVLFDICLFLYEFGYLPSILIYLAEPESGAVTLTVTIIVGYFAESGSFTKKKVLTNRRT